MARRRPMIVPGLAGALALTVMGVPTPAPLGATIGDPPSVVDVPVDDPTAVGFGTDLGARRAFVLGATETFVVTEAGEVVDTLAVGGQAIGRGSSRMAVLDADAGTVTDIDVGTLATATWSLAPYERLSGLAVARDHAWTSARDTDGTTAIVEIALDTGVVREVATGLGATPLHLVAASASDVVALEDDAQGPTAVWSVATQVGAGPPVLRSLPGPPVEQADLTDLQTGLTVVQGEAVTTYRLADLTTLRSVPVTGTDPVLEGTGDLAVTSGRGPDPIATILSRHSPDHPQRVPVESPAIGPGAVAVSDNRTVLYVLGADGDLQLLDLLPEVTRARPKVLSPIGGETLTLDGRGLAGALVFIESKRATVVSSTDTRHVVRTVPFDDSCACRTQYSVSSALDHGVGQDLRIARLGPYSGGHSLADGAYADLVDRPPTAAERDAVDDAVYETGVVGTPFATLAVGDEARGPRPALLRLYRALLGRWADTDGLAYWVEAMEGGRSLSSVARAFAAAPEFAATYGDVGLEDLVERLYLKVLGRSPEPGGFAYWVDALASGTSPGRVALLFSESAEHRARTAQEVDVTILRLGMLGVVPGSARRAADVDRLRSGVTLATIAGEILVGPEYARTH